MVRPLSDLVTYISNLSLELPVLLLSLDLSFLHSLHDFLGFPALIILQSSQIRLFTLELSVNTILERVYLLNEVGIHGFLVVLA